MTIEEVDSQTNTDRLVAIDVGTVDKDDTITVTVDGETFTGPVTRIDTYGPTTDVERVVQFNMNFKHHIDGPEWVPWKAYLIEEPAGRYRLNVVESEGNVSRTINQPAFDEIVVE